MISRSAGLLLHPTSLPDPLGIGSLGHETEAFLEWAAAGGQSVWQVLPLGPTGLGNAPYGCLSTFAGNPFLISPERLIDRGYLPFSAIEEAPRFPEDRVDYARVAAWKRTALRRSWENFRRHGSRQDVLDLEAFVNDDARREWLDDWVLFSALRRHFDGRAWVAWDRELAQREPTALVSARRALADELAYHRYLQFLFFAQWEGVKRAANKRGILVMGDLPIYVAYDSADVWANAHLFDLDPEGHPRHVAGVPPDYFSDTGQLWGNPLYRWDRMKEEAYAWWIARMRGALRLSDLVRLDHFRAFESYWEVPVQDRTAVNGRWVLGPGASLLEALRAALGELPLVAEDLGTITADVRTLREQFGLPGMKVLQFAFTDPASDHLPSRHEPNSVVYTGTHDNDTTRGWFASLGEGERALVLGHFASDGSEIEWNMIRAAYESEGRLVVVPVQDVFGLGSEARMNTPGRSEGNWTWRARKELFRPELADRLRRMAEETGRLPAVRLSKP